MFNRILRLMYDDHLDIDLSKILQTQGKQHNFKLSTLKVELGLCDPIVRYWFIERKERSLSIKYDV